MMNLLGMAHEALNASYGDIDTELTIAFAMQAQAYAAIAQAEAALKQTEQLKRIGDCLNAMASTLAGIEAAHFEANVLRKEITTDVKREFSPDPQDYHTESAYLEALEKYNDWRAQIEYGQDTDEEAEARTDYADPLN